jgi:hypothetical protein
VAALLLLVVLLPFNGSDSRAAVPPPRVPTVAEVSRANAVTAVDKVLRQRMSYLDDERREALAGVVVDESLSCNLDPLFVLAVGDAESRLDHEAVSPTGARGLFQVIPSTWEREVRRRGLGRLEKFNVVHNARVGIGYLCHLSESFKRGDSLLLAYNQGPGGASDILAKRVEPTEEAATYAGKVWAAYKKLLAQNHLPNDAKTMRLSFKSPESTVYTTLLGYSGDVHGPTIKEPVKVRTKPRVVEAPKSRAVEAPKVEVPVVPYIQPIAWSM